MKRLPRSFDDIGGLRVARWIPSRRPVSTTGRDEWLAAARRQA